MNYFKLRKLQDKLYFSVNDLAVALGITLESAKVQSSRYIKKGLFIRLKKNFYIFKTKWDALVLSDYFKIANILQVPSYVSFMTALAYYEVSTQMQQGYIESVGIKRKREFEIEIAAEELRPAERRNK